MIISLFRWFVMFLAVFFQCFRGLFLIPFGKAGAFYRKQTIPFGRNLLRMMGGKPSWDGLEYLNPEEHYVFVGNHQSYADICLIFTALGSAKREVLFMAKKELFSIPLFGTTIKQLGLVPVEREESRQALKSMLEAIDKIKSGYSLVIFPEGTRGDGVNLLPFKRGGFLLAERTGQKIVPFAITGTAKLLPRGLRITPGPVHISFLPPIEPGPLKSKELGELIEKQIREKLEENFKKF